MKRRTYNLLPGLTSLVRTRRLIVRRHEGNVSEVLDQWVMVSRHRWQDQQSEPGGARHGGVHLLRGPRATEPHAGLSEYYTLGRGVSIAV